MLRPKETFRPGQPVMKGHPGLQTRGSGNLMKQPGTGRIAERKTLIRTLPGRLHCLNREAATLETTFGSTSPGADRPSIMVCHGAPSIVAGRQADLQQACTLALRKAAGEVEGFADCFFLPTVVGLVGHCGQSQDHPHSREFVVIAQKKLLAGRATVEKPLARPAGAGVFVQLQMKDRRVLVGASAD